MEVLGSKEAWGSVHGGPLFSLVENQHRMVQEAEVNGSLQVRSEVDRLKPATGSLVGPRLPGV